MLARARCRLKHWQPVTGCHLATSSRCWQALVRDGILRGIRGPHGGYELGRERNRITADDILRAATTVDEVDALQPSSALVNEIVWPALAETERTVCGRISIEK